MNDIIESVTNDVVDIKDIKADNGKKKINRITVNFLNASKKGWRIRVETATLKNYIEETGGYVVLKQIAPCIGLTNCKSVDFLFEDDEIILIDGAEFTITVRKTIWDKNEEYIFVLKNEKWKLKEEEENGQTNI